MRASKASIGLKLGVFVFFDTFYEGEVGAQRGKGKKKKEGGERGASDALDGVFFCWVYWKCTEE